MKKLGFILIVLFSLYAIHYTPYTTLAQTSCLQNNLAEGLISSSQTVEGLGNPQKVCVISDRAAFVSYKLPTYDDLKSIYFTQSKVAKVTNNTTSLGSATDNTVYNYTNTSSDITTGTYNYSGTSVIFIEGSIYINGNITGPTDKGLVLVVKNNVNIDRNVNRVDAVIIAGGPIYTAGVGCASSSIVAGQLVINGSLISLNQANPPVFCRNLNDNSQAAEKIVWQPKYLVILKDLFSDIYQKWSEIP